MGIIVAVRNLHKRYGRIEAVRGVSFEVEAGTILGLLGPNGAGKTTVVECLLGLRSIDEGFVEICGLDTRLHPSAVKEQMGAALQTTALQDKVTPREALALFGSFYPQSASPESLLRRFALEAKADHAFDTLSGGQRQRLALALAFVNHPKVVVLDEPTTGLDPEARRELQAEILQMKRDGHTVLLTTHQLDEAERLCDTVAIIDRGAVIASGSPQSLIAGLTDVHTVTLETAAPLDAALTMNLPDVHAAEIDGTRLRFQTSRAEPALTALLALLAKHHNAVVELHVNKGSLEDVFLRLTRETTETSQGEKVP